LLSRYRETELEYHKNRSPSVTQSTPIKVLQILDKLGVKGSMVHGVSRALSWWIPRFDSSQFEISVCSLRAPEPAIEVFRQAGIEVTFLSKGKFDPTTLTSIMALIDREKPDILHLHDYGATTFGRIAGFLKGVPRLVHEHSPLPNQPIYQTLADFALARMTTKAVAVSDSVRDFMIRERHVKPELIETFFVGIPLDEFQLPDADVLASTRQELAIGPEDKVIATVGRLDPAKGQVYLLEAAKLVLDELPNTRFLIVGDGSDLEMLQARAATLGVEQGVTFTGFRSDIPAIYGISDVVAMPSLWEGKPIALLEAMNLGKPTVGTPWVLSADIMSNGGVGLSVPTEDSAALAEKLLVLLRDPALAQEMGARAKERSKDFDVSITIERLSRIYRELAGAEIER
jgi:glycosyltransferase involved in cell wall biosynthesis